MMAGWFVRLILSMFPFPEAVSVFHRNEAMAGSICHASFGETVPVWQLRWSHMDMGSITGDIPGVPIQI